MKVLKAIVILLMLSFLISCANNETQKENLQKYTVEFDSDGGSLVLTQEVEWGECVTQPNNPVKTGYIFKGWYNGESPYYFSQAVTQNISLKAEWRPNTYKIIFDKNEAIDNASSMSKVLCTYDVEYQLPENTYTSTGATFLGWATEKDGEPCYEDCQAVKNLSSVNGDTITLYAIWSKNLYHKIFYQNLFDSENAAENPRKFLENQTIVILPPSERTGFSFDGWYLNSDYSGNAVSGWISGSHTTDVTLYAKWNPSSYTVTLKDRGNTTELTIRSGESMPTYTIPEIVGAYFGGFYTKPYAKGTQYINSTGIGNKEFYEAKDITLYAYWEYKITYVIDNPENIGYVNPNPLTYTGEKRITLSDLTVRTGYKFYGWKDENGQVITKIPKDSSGARVLTSKGLEVIVYTITYNLNEGTWNTSEGYPVPQFFTIESDEITLPSQDNIERTGFIFEGWYETEDFSGQEIKAIPKGTFENKTLYAKWTEE